MNMDNIEVNCAKKKDPLDYGILEEALGGPEACALAEEVEKTLSIKSTKIVNGLVNGLSERKCSEKISKKVNKSISESLIENKKDIVTKNKSSTSTNKAQEDSETSTTSKTVGCQIDELPLPINQHVEPTKVSLITTEEINCNTENSLTVLNENANCLDNPSPSLESIEYVQYESELQMPMIMKIIQKDLSEPYSIYTYRYFIHNWPKLCFLAMCKDKCVGAIVCKLDIHRKTTRRGYIAMLAVDKDYRKRSIGSTLVRRAIEEMIAGDADEVVLETEVTNEPALKLYGALGFVRDKRLFRYYLNGVDALRLKLWLR